MTGLSILADVFDPNSPKDWVQWGGLVGVLMLLVTGFLKGWLVPGWMHERELNAKDDLIGQRDERITQLETENREQALFLRDQATPLLTRTQDVLVKILEERAWDERARRQREKPS